MEQATSHNISLKINEIQESVLSIESTLAEKSAEFEKLQKQSRELKVRQLLDEVGANELNQTESALKKVSSIVVELNEKLETYKQALSVLQQRYNESLQSERIGKSEELIKKAEALVKDKSRLIVELQSAVNQINCLKTSSCSVLGPGDNDLHRGKWEMFLTHQRRAEIAIRELRMFFELEERNYINFN